MLKYFSDFKVLLRLVNFNAIEATEETILNKITNKVQKNKLRKR